LLVHRISRDDIYQRQGGDTIITWTDPDINTDIALSFQEAVGCNYIWEQIKSVQQSYAKTDVKGGGELDLPGRLRRGAVDEYEFGSAPGDGFYTDSGRAGPSELPPAMLGSLPELVKTVAECSPFAREKIASLVLRKGYLRQLLDLFRTCEDLDDRDGLHTMYRLVRGLVLLNDASLFDELLRDENVWDVMGALEYDPDLAESGGGGEGEGGGGGGGDGDGAAPGVAAEVSGAGTPPGTGGREVGAEERRVQGGASTDMDAAGTAADASAADGGEVGGDGRGTQPTVQHRAFLRDSVVFKEVVPIHDVTIKAKIHQTYRIGYLKDVILPRVLDDATFGTLTSIMLFNNVEVVLALQNDPTFLKELFAKLRATPRAHSEWDDLVGFLQELCSLAKHLQTQQRGHLFASLVQHGLFHVLTDVLLTDSERAQLKGADVLVSTLHNDPSALRAFLVKQEEHTLFTRVVQLFVEGEEGLQAQLHELLKLMLDPDTMDQPVEKSGFLELFYDAYVDRLVASVSAGVRDEPPPAAGRGSGTGGRGEGSAMATAGARVVGAATAMATATTATVPAWTLVKTIELLCFCVQHHSFRIKYYVLRNNVVEKVLNLTQRREKYLVVAAVRFLRACVGLKDEFYNRYIIKNSLFAPVMRAFAANGARYNLLNSAVLELVDFVRRENIKNLIVHLVEEYEPMFADVDYVDTFRLLKLRYDQGQHPPGMGMGMGLPLAPNAPPGPPPPPPPGLRGPSGGDGGTNGATHYNGNVAFSREAIAAQRALATARSRRDGSMSKSEEDYFNSEDDDEEGMDDDNLDGRVILMTPEELMASILVTKQGGGDKGLPVSPSLRGVKLPPLSARFVPMRGAFSPPVASEGTEGGAGGGADVYGSAGGSNGQAARGEGSGGAVSGKRAHEEGMASGDLGKRPRYTEDDDDRHREGMTAAQCSAPIGANGAAAAAGDFLGPGEAAHGGGSVAHEEAEGMPASKAVGSWVSVVDSGDEAADESANRKV